MDRTAFYNIQGAAGQAGDGFFIGRFRSNTDSTDARAVALNTDHEIYIGATANDGSAYAVAFKLDGGGSEKWTKANTSIDYYIGAQVDSTDEARVYFVGGDTGEFYCARHNATNGDIVWDENRTRSGISAQCAHLGGNGNDRLCIAGWSGGSDFQGQLGDVTLWVVDVSSNTGGATNDNFAVGSGAHDGRGGNTIAQFSDSSSMVFMAGYNQHGDSSDKLVICENSGTTRNRTIAFSDSGGTPGSLAVDTQAGPVYGMYNGNTNTTFVFKITPSGTSYSINWGQRVGNQSGGNAISFRGTLKLYDTNNSKLLCAVEDQSGNDAVHIYSLNTSDGSVNWERRLSSSSSNLSCEGLVIDPVDQEYFVIVGTDTSGSNSALVCKLPIDGTGTGTYGDITYGTSGTHGISGKTISTLSRSVSNTTTNWGSGASPGYSLTNKTLSEIQLDTVNP
jgi:hypothetical protein